MQSNSKIQNCGQQNIQSQCTCLHTIPISAADINLDQIEKMQKHSPWAPVFAAVPEGSWCPDKQELANLKQQLGPMTLSFSMAAGRSESTSFLERLRACFFPKVCHIDFTPRRQLVQGHSACKGPCSQACIFPKVCYSNFHLTRKLDASAFFV